MIRFRKRKLCRGCLVLAAFLLLLLSLAVRIPVHAEGTLQEEELYAASAVLMDGTTGRVLYAKNGQEPMANASTTKILTCIVALENAGMDEVVTVSSLAASAPKVHLGMRKEQQFYLKDLLYGLMLESFNDCAVAIAEHVGGSVEAFAELMNEKAVEIGCRDTHFVTPNGLDADGHHTTAADLALIMRYCVSLSPKAEQFLTITQTQNYSFGEITKGTAYNCNNHNALLQMMEGAVSGKTGYTSKAGYCYVGAVHRDGHLYIVSLLACGWPNHKSYKWADMRTMIQYALDTYLFRPFATERELTLPDQLVVENARTEQIDGVRMVNVLVEVPKGDPLPQYEGMLMAEEEEMQIEIELPQALNAPVQKGDRIGAVHYRLDGVCYRHLLLYAGESAAKKDYGWSLEKVWELFSMKR